MERQRETIRKIAIILAPDDKGLQEVFGLPAIRRLTLLTHRLGIEEIHDLGRVKALEPSELEQSGLTLKIMALMSNRDFANILVVLALGSGSLVSDRSRIRDLSFCGDSVAYELL